MRQVLQVDLGSRSYPILMEEGCLARLGHVCREQKLSGTCLLVSDLHVDEYYGKQVEDSLRGEGFVPVRAVVPAGETSKSGEQLFHLYRDAVEAGLNRSSFVVALGGGVVGDLAGYLAASFLRGIAYVQVPTTIVSMVDSAVGGKTGINLPEGKNLVGAFWQPAVVAIDFESLASLPDREYRSGLAEVVKYGVIRDVEFFCWLEENRQAILSRDPDAQRYFIARSCEIKAEVVQEDEREGGLRAILNFGHTVGHAIEKVSRYGTFLHGEAIALGMVFAAMVSRRIGKLPDADVDRISALLRGLGLPVAVPDLSWSALRLAVAVDKKRVGETPQFVLADSVGSVRFGCEVDDEALAAVWGEMGNTEDAGQL